MTVANFIPKLWDSTLHTAFRRRSLAAGLTNTEYEGILARGNTVQITNLVDVAIKDYKANGRTTTPDPVETTKQDLVIDQEKNYDFLIDDIDAKQAAGSLNGYAESAVYGLAQDADKFLFAKAIAGADANHIIDPADLAFAADDPKGAYNIVKRARALFNKADVPLEQRWLIMNSDFEAPFLDYDSKFTKAGEIGGNEGVRQAYIGDILGFKTLVTDNLPGTATDQPQALFVHTPVWHYVSQFTKSEAMRANDTFADRVRGLHVYGGKVVEPLGVAQYTGTAPAAG